MRRNFSVPCEEFPISVPAKGWAKAKNAVFKRWRVIDSAALELQWYVWMKLKTGFILVAHGGGG